MPRAPLRRPRHARQARGKLAFFTKGTRHPAAQSCCAPPLAPSPAPGSFLDRTVEALASTPAPSCSSPRASTVKSTRSCTSPTRRQKLLRGEGGKEGEGRKKEEGVLGMEAGGGAQREEAQGGNPAAAPAPAAAARLATEGRKRALRSALRAPPEPGAPDCVVGEVQRFDQAPDGHLRKGRGRGAAQLGLSHSQRSRARRAEDRGAVLCLAPAPWRGLWQGKQTGAHPHDCERHGEEERPEGRVLVQPAAAGAGRPAQLAQALKAGRVLLVPARRQLRLHAGRMGAA